MDANESQRQFLSGCRKGTVLVSLYPAEQQADVAAALTLESEPMNALLQENAEREILLRQRVNDAARAVMLAYAKRYAHLSADHLAHWVQPHTQVVDLQTIAG